MTKVSLKIYCAGHPLSLPTQNFGKVEHFNHLMCLNERIVALPVFFPDKTYGDEEQG